MSDAHHGPPPGWPASPLPDPPPAGAFGPGKTMVGEPLVEPSFPEAAGAEPARLTVPGDAPIDLGGSPYAAGMTAVPTDGGVAFGGAPDAFASTAPYGPPMHGGFAPTAPMAPMAPVVVSPARTASKAPIALGVGAIVVAVLGAIGVVVVRHRASQAIDDDSVAAIDLPKESKKRGGKGTDDAEAAAPPSVEEPTPSEPEPEVTEPEVTEPEPAPPPTAAPPAPRPTATATATATAKPTSTATASAPLPTSVPTSTSTSTAPAPTSTAPAPTSTGGGRRPIPGLRLPPAPTATSTPTPTATTPAPAPTGTGSGSGRRRIPTISR